MRGEISIQKALDEMRDPERKQPFVLQFARGTGKKKGSLKTVRAFYGRSKQEDSNEPKRAKASASHKTHGTFPINNADTGEYETPLIALMRSYDGFRIKH